MTVFSKNGLGMKLHTFNRQLLVPDAHDLIDLTILVLGPGGNLKTIRQGVLVDYQ